MFMLHQTVTIDIIVVVVILEFILVLITSHNWRHASLASKGPNKILVLLPFSWKKQWDIFSIHLLQIRQFVAIGTYLNNKKMVLAH
ncbi:hypothetical protein L6452_24798 [Arctium lappa]|uniref:Uncharacterized protein n=1 Tax=Arctium lappa TaxID=4217 RepID=A0ACB9AB33_ARCLA|nr:hypothetical protein L6452_24798 [Arctium lappa]